MLFLLLILVKNPAMMTHKLAALLSRYYNAVYNTREKRYCYNFLDNALNKTQKHHIRRIHSLCGLSKSLRVFRTVVSQYGVSMAPTPPTCTVGSLCCQYTAGGAYLMVFCLPLFNSNKFKRSSDFNEPQRLDSKK